MIDYDKPILNKKGEPLRILLAAHHVCIRVIKRLRALKKIGYKVDGLGNRISYGTDDFDTYSIYQNDDQLKNWLYDNKDKYDIIDYSNEPDFPVRVIKEAVGDSAPVITDLHDLDSVRKGFIPKDEREMFNLSDGLIYVSQPIQKITNKLHQYTKPNTTYYSYCNKDTIDYDPNLIHQRRGLVYEGGCNPKDDQIQNQMFAYRNLGDILKRLVEMGNEVHCYFGNLSAFDTLQDIGIISYPPQQYDQMMQYLTRYRYGILIFNNKDQKQDQVNYTLSNKQYEFLASGLPALACWCPEMMKQIDKWKIGFTFNDIEEIGNCSQLEDKYLEVMDNIREVKEKLTAENFIWRIENLYAEVLGVEKKGIPKDIKKLSEFEYGKEDTNKSLS